MNLQNVTNALQVLNPYRGANPKENCTTCAVDAAKALIGGARPTTESAHSTTNIVSPVESWTVKTFPTGIGGAANVLNWFSQQAPTGVFVIETEDHHYNIVKHHGVYLIDSNSQAFCQLNVIGDAIINNPAFGNSYNYLDPESDPEENDPEVTVHYWGALHGNWH